MAGTGPSGHEQGVHVPLSSYAEYVRTGLHGRRFLRTAEEQRLLRVAVEDHGLDYATARRLLGDEARRNRVTRQNEVDDATVALLQARAGRNRPLSSAEFQRTVAFYRARAGGQMPQAEVDSRVKQLVDAQGLEPKREGWLWRSRSWYDRIPDQVPATAESTVQPGARPAGSGGRSGVPTHRLLDQWAQRVNAGHVDAVVALYAPRGLLLATAAPEPRIGPEPIRQYFQGLLAHPALSVRVGPVLASTEGNPATVSGLYVFSWTGADGRPIEVPSRYTFVLTPAPQNSGSSLDGSIAQHHSSALPNRPGSGEI